MRSAVSPDSLRHIAGALVLASLAGAAHATTEIQFWHAMEGPLGDRVNAIAQDFNASQKDYKVVPVFKGNYDEVLSGAIAAFRSGNAPHIVQVFEVGTATMMQAGKAIKPVGQVMKDAGEPFDEKLFIPAVAGYYSDAKTGHLVSMPFNSSTPILYYNKDAFRKAGLNPEQPPRTWPELAQAAAKLKASGMSCGYTTGWQGWVLLENFSTWHDLPFASKDNGFGGAGAELRFNSPAHVRHIEFLAKMVKDGTFSYVGRKDEATPKFYSGECGIMTGSSGSQAAVRKNAKFAFGMGMMPYYPDMKGAPQNAIIGGASLWVMGGKSAAEYKGVARFLKRVAAPEVAAAWHQQTGYLPVTGAAFELTRKQGFYEKNPGADIAARQMMNKPPKSYTRGLRLGYMPQIRSVVDEELESVWSGKQQARPALDQAVARGNELLRRFEKTAN
ncbi:sn-glycerol-3-phosphate ABC transporter substrate-binding protein UgpB [Paludibacterium paludis]|uniref:sn-glycerol-3-phosphate-binding periplasmic protein UgpB n=1 Tax=Paludibacterium paludis TaxID=1225769 RepID=A0A918P5U8_9NEIS|nr:sn-glycerol-3-phosphate ABC transporter substrate-binding protein UgpB [Paludibacterium paludis]GGY23023.1 sn-glycerol-3-phosphate ABC transporter substrate-binding protein [Paludibacterium paludis]